MKKNITILISFLISLLGFQSFAQPDSWIKKDSIGGSGRYGAASFSIGTKGYIGTGFPKSKDFWEYDSFSDTWSQKSDFGGTARFIAVGFSIGTKGYIGTGNDGVQQNDFWEFDPILNLWTKKADFGGIPRDAAVGFSIGSKGYLGTGELDDAFNTKLNDFWEYDPSTDAWTRKSDVGITGRSWAVGFSISNRGYIGTGNTVSRSKDFLEYNPDTDTWTYKTPFGGVGRFGATGCSNGTYGFIGLGDIGGGYSNDFWEYNPSSDTWIKKTDFGGAIRSLATGFSIQNKVYIGSGADNILGLKYKDFWEYTPSCSTPIITSQPADQSIAYGNSTTFVVAVADAVTYQWQEDAGLGFADINDGGIYSNTTTSILTISLPTVNMTGYKYRCVLTGNCLLTATSDGNATLTIAPLDVIITPGAGQTKVYGSADPAPFTYTFSPALIGTDVISGTMNRDPGENAGNYAFTTGTLTASANYKLTVTTIPTFSITAVALTITAEDKEKCFDGATFSGVYTVNYTGFVTGEDPTVLSGTLVFGGTSATGTIAGNYSIDPSGLTSTNYSIGYVNGALIIKATPNAPVITRSGDSLISSITTGNHWYLDGVEIIGSNGNVHVATVNGTYYSIITTDGCSSAQSNSIAVLNASIKEVSAELFDIYPNPSNGVLNIKLKKASNALYNIEIYNSLGALIWKQDNANIDANNIKKIELNSPKSGLYTVVLRNKAASFAKKIYIKK